MLAWNSCQRPYHVENTGSRPITEVKQHRAQLVLWWVTAWERCVPLASQLFCLYFNFFYNFLLSCDGLLYSYPFYFFFESIHRLKQFQIKDHQYHIWFDMFVIQNVSMSLYFHHCSDYNLNDCVCISIKWPIILLNVSECV